MPTIQERLYRLVGQQRGCEFSLRFVLRKEKDLWKSSFVMLRLVKKGTRKRVIYDYGEFILGEKLLNIQEGLRAISALYQKNGEKGKLTIPGYDEFAVDGGHENEAKELAHTYLNY